MEQFGEDLYYVLVDKCTSHEAITRIRAVSEGDGISAFARLRHWYVGSSGMAITQRTQLITNPTVPKSEEAIAEAIDKWKQQLRVVEAMGAQYQAPETLKKDGPQVVNGRQSSGPL